MYLLINRYNWIFNFMVQGSVSNVSNVSSVSSVSNLQQKFKT